MSNTATAQAGARLAALARRIDAIIPAIADMNDEQAVAANKAAWTILSALSTRKNTIESRRAFADFKVEHAHHVGDMDDSAFKTWLDGLSHSAELLYPDGMYLSDIGAALRIMDQTGVTFLDAAAYVGWHGDGYQYYCGCRALVDAGLVTPELEVTVDDSDHEVYHLPISPGWYDLRVAEVTDKAERKVNASAQQRLAGAWLSALADHPHVSSLRAAGLTDVQICSALGIAPNGDQS